MYHCLVTFAGKIAEFVRRHRMIAPGNRVGVAVSGGADSVALLRALLELRGDLGCVLAVVHYNHGIRPEAAREALFVRGLAEKFGLEFFGDQGDARLFAREQRVSLETAARELRYGWFEELTSRPSAAPKGAYSTNTGTQGLRPGLSSAAPPALRRSRPEALASRNRGDESQPDVQAGGAQRAFDVTSAEEQQRKGALNKIATAHTLDDQAETVLMKMIRGAGTKGLSGIWPVVRRQEAGGREQENNSPRPSPSTRAEALARDDKFEIIRPMLGVRRLEVEAYLRSIGQPWCEDASNRDVKHTRNKVRHELLPMLEREYNPNIYCQLADLAEVARGEEEFWGQYLVVGTQCLVDGSNQKSRTQETGGRRREHSAISGQQSGNANPSAAPSLRSGSLDIDGLTQQPLAVRRRVLREAFRYASGKSLDFEHTEELVKFLDKRESSRLQLPEGWFAVMGWPKREIRFEMGTEARKTGSKLKKKEAGRGRQENRGPSTLPAAAGSARDDKSDTLAAGKRLVFKRVQGII